MDMVAGFRDVISICCILEARQKTLRYGRNAGPIYSNSFSLYPWMLSPHINRLVAITPAIEAIHRLDKFHGQTSPEIPIHEINAQSSDEGLVGFLLSRWRDRYFEAKDDWQNLALLRSLNMANAAMQLPAGTDLVFHDFGRSLGNWISAFEILIHPGQNGAASKQKVFELLDKIVWNSEKITSELFSTPDRFKGTVDLPLVKHIYGQLYYLRNQFLHGNPVSSDQLYFPNKLPVLNFAAPLYRMALAAFLGQIQRRIPADASDEDALALKWENHNRTKFQPNFEDALKMAVSPIEVEVDE